MSMARIRQEGRAEPLSPPDTLPDRHPGSVSVAAYLPGRSSRWYTPKSRKVGGHWPTKTLQLSLPDSFKPAEITIDATAPQYQACSGMEFVI